MNATTHPFSLPVPASTGFLSKASNHRTAKPKVKLGSSRVDNLIVSEISALYSDKNIQNFNKNVQIHI